LLHLHLSNDLGRLADAFARRVGADPLAAAFARPLVLVPSRVVAGFLKDRLAAAHGVCAGLEARFLEPWLGELLAGDDVRLLDRARLEALLAGLLLAPDDLGGPALEPVRRYLAAGGDAPEDRARRAAELARRLAAVFAGYAAARPEALAEWRAGGDAFGGADPATEAWERALWGRLRDRLEAARAATGVRWVPLAERLAEVEPAALDLPAAVDAFGLEALGGAQQEALVRLAAATEVRLYLFAPALPGAAGELPGWAREAGGRLGDLADATPPLERPAVAAHPLVADWAAPALELPWALRRRAEAAGVAGEVTVDLRDPTAGGPTLLSAFQRDVLLAEPAPAAPAALPLDRSLRAHACPSRRAEVELLASEVWRRVEEAPGSRPLRFDECGVVVAGDLEAYLPLVRSVFRAAHRLPSTLLSGAAPDRLLEAARALLELPAAERLDRPTLLAAVAHPAVAARFELDPRAAQAWAAELGFHLGADADDHAGTYLEGIARYTIAQALRRLVLGAFLAGPASGELRTAAVGGEAVPPADVGEERRAEAARFAALVRAVVADATWLRTAELTLAEWGEAAAALVSSYVAARGDAEERDLGRLLQRLRALARCEVPGAETRVGFAVARAFALEAVDEVAAAAGRELAGGVLVGTRLPPVPLRFVAVLGLSADAFPAPDVEDELDLRRDRRPGEVTPRQADLGCLLATLTSAEAVHLSYVDRALDGDPRYPSPAIDHLGLLVRRRLLGPRPDGAEPWRVDHPTDRSGPRTFPELFPHDPPEGPTWPSVLPEAREEARARALRADLARHLGREPRVDLAALRAGAGPEVRAAVDGLVAPAEPPPAPSAAGPLEVPLGRLRAFLKSALQGTARFVGLAEAPDEDPLGTGREPVATPFLDRLGLLRELFWRALAAQADGAPLDLAGRLDALLDREVPAGRRAPSGLFRELERRRMLATLEGWAAGVAADLPPTPRLVVHRFGGVATGPGDVVHPAIALRVATPGPDGAPVARDVRLTGATARVLADGTASLSLAASVRWEERDYALDGFLSHVALAAAGVPRTSTFRAVVAPPRAGARFSPKRLAPLAPDVANAYLSDLAADLLRGQDTLFPIEPVLYHAHLERQGKGGSLEGMILSERGKRPPRASFRYGPIPDPERRPVLPEADLRDLQARRFGLYARLVAEAAS